MKKNSSSENFKNFKIPENFFNKLFEFTGSDDSSRGFIVAYVDQDGCPMIYSKVCSPIVEMGLIKAIEKYLDEVDNEQQPLDITPEE
jgi:hypothetical protein